MTGTINLVIAILTLIATILGYGYKIIKELRMANEKRIQFNREQNKKYEELKSGLADVKLLCIRNELQNAIEHDYGIHTVSSIYEEYRKMGGNSYMKHRYEDYYRYKKEEYVE